MRAILVVFASCLVSIAGAVERTWKGASGGVWSDAANWDPEGVPTSTDTLVFRPADRTSVMVNSTVLAGAIRCESGVTYILGNSGGIYMGDDTNEFYVAEDAVAICSNAIHAVNAKNGKAVFAKTGRGVLSAGGRGWSATSYKFARYDIREGELRLHTSANYPLNDPTLHVCDGAKVTCGTSYRIHTAQIVDIDAGGVVDFGGAEQLPKSITGYGVITNHGSIKLYLTDGKCTFSGRLFRSGNGAVQFNTRPSGMSDEDWGFVIGASNTLASSGINMPGVAGRVLRFAAGVTNFYIKSVSVNSGTPHTLVLEDVDGHPVSVYGDNVQPTRLKLAGSGSFFHIGDQRTYNSSIPSLSDFSGVLGVAGSRTLCIGDGTEAGMLDISTVSGFATADSGSTMVFKYAAVDTPFAVAAPVYGPGNIQFYGHLTFSNISASGGCWYFRDKADVTISGGSSELDGNQFYFYGNNKLTLKNGARLVRKAARLSHIEWSALKRYSAFKIYSGASSGTLTLTNCAFASFEGSAPASTTVADGSTFEVAGGLSGTGDITVNGGTLRLTTERNASTMLYTLDVNKGGKLPIYVGRDGMVLDCADSTHAISGGHSKFAFESAVATGVEGGDDGGIVRKGSGTVYFYSPLTITGTFDNRDGTLILPNKSAVTGATEPMFGYGDFRLGNARLLYDDAITTTFTLKLATTAGKAMYYDGAAMLCQRTYGKPTQNIEIGPSGAAQDASLVRGGRGAAFFLWNDIATDDPADGGTVTVNGGLSTDTTGRIIAPVFHYVNCPGSVSYSSTSNRRLGFLSCNNAGVLTAFTGETDGLGGGANSVAAVTNATTLSESAAVAALKVTAVKGSSSTLTIPDGVTLSVGDGTNPATVLINNLSSTDIATIKGDGTLDFGTSEGLVAINRSLFETSAPHIDCRIAGSGGLSLVAPVDGGSHDLVIGGANTYTGGTMINGVRVRPGNNGAFSSGAVVLGMGHAGGGALLVNSANIPNELRIAGYGPISTIDGSTTYGAILFTESGELSGNVNVYAPVRLSARGAGVRGTFSGVVSGDSIELWNCTGMIVLSGLNTYTGGTTAVSSTLTLKGNGTAGTGGVVLDNSTLRIENDAAKTVANKVSGIGTLALAGSGAVTFASLAPENSGFVLDVCGGERKLAGSFAGIASVTNSASARGVLTVASNGSWSGDVGHDVGIGVAAGVRFRLGADATLPADARIYLANGATLDLDGAERTVRTVYGHGTVVNGTLTETKPFSGTIIVVM